MNLKQVRKQHPIKDQAEYDSAYHEAGIEQEQNVVTINGPVDIKSLKWLFKTWLRNV